MQITDLYYSANSSYVMSLLLKYDMLVSLLCPRSKNCNVWHRNKPNLSGRYLQNVTNFCCIIVKNLRLGNYYPIEINSNR